MSGNTSVSLRDIPISSSKRKKYGYCHVVDVRFNGKRIRQRYFRYGELNLAEAYKKKELLELGKLAGKDRRLLTDKVRDDAIQAIKDLEKWDATISEAVSFYIQHREASEKLNLTPMSQVIGELRDLKDKEKVSTRYAQDLKNRLNNFEEAFHNRPLSTITKEELKQWIGQRGSLSTQQSFKRLISVLLNFAVDRKYIDKNPLDEVYRSRKTRATKAAEKNATKGVAILKPSQVSSLFSHCPSDMVPAVALAFFAGIRDNELNRLTWDLIDVHEGVVKITADVSKTGTERTINITENLKQWLLPYAELEGAIRPRNWRRRWTKLRQESGIGGECYPRNGARHSFASYFLEESKSEAVTAKQLGHGIGVLKEHYMSLTTPRTAKAYFEIKPAQVSNVIPLSVNG